MNKLKIKNYLFMALGAILIGIGILFFSYANLGADAMTTIEQGIARRFGTTLVVGQIIVNVFFFALLLVGDYKRVSLETILSVFLISLGIEMAAIFVPEVKSIYIRYLYMFIGLTTIGLGIAVGALSPSGNNPYDGFVLLLSQKTKIPFGTMRSILDGIILIIGIILGGSFGVGTIVAIILQGVLANSFMKLLNKVIKYQKKRY